MISDLTVLFITANEMPPRWATFQLDHLFKSICGAPIISLSRRPMDLGVNLLDTEPKSYWNIFMQVLKGAKAATTPYVAVAEDDVLYTPEHFMEFRPPMDTVSYDRSRWSLFTWDPLYCLRQRVSNCSMIAPRDLAISAFEEWREKWPEGASDSRVGEIGRSKIEHRMGVTEHKMVEWYCTNPIIHLNHPTGTDTGSKIRERDGRRMVKRHGQIKAFDIPYWGKATDIAAMYDG